MKKYIVVYAGILLSVLFISVIHAQREDFSVLKGPYLGQKPPGMTPEIFAPGIISTKETNEGCTAFLSGASIFVFRWYDPGPVKKDIFYMTSKKGVWSRPQPAPFDSRYGDGDFTAAPDGKTLYFTSSRPLDGKNMEPIPSNIWVTTIKDGEWSKPHPLGPSLNTEYGESYPAVTEKGTIYFFSRRPGGFGKADIYRSRLKNGDYTEAENLGSVINTGYEEWDPFIAADESFLVFCSTKPGGFGRDDLYISFRRQDGTWTKPLNLGEDFNSYIMDNRPCVTPDGKYFFFISGKSGNRDVYWVDAKFITKLKLKDIR